MPILQMINTVQETSSPMNVPSHFAAGADNLAGRPKTLSITHQNDQLK